MYAALAVFGFFAIASLFSRCRYLLFTAIGMLATNGLYILLFKDNLHCDQFSSFFIAFFDFTPHPEEIPEPLVYNHIWGVFIRLFYAVVLLLVCIAPSVFILKHKHHFQFKKHAWPVLTFVASGVTVFFLPESIIGERIYNFMLYPLLLNIVLAVMFYVFYGVNYLIKEW